jgi:RNA polymerase sigma factor (sigma-70 family)
MTEDAELLSRYAADHSEPAITELIQRHVDLVYSAALRLVSGDAHRAQDVTQQVFVELTRNARKLAGHPALVGWLYTTTRRIAMHTNRTEQRRKNREQEAHAMTELLRETAPDEDWDQLRPVLEEAMHDLGEKDRLAVLLRYFQNKPLKEVGAVLGLNENAARMRVDRALDKLHGLLTQRGVTLSAAGLGAVLVGNAVQAAPVGLAVAISTAAALAGTTLATTATATAIKTIAMTTLQKTLITATLAAAVGTGIYEARRASQLREQVQSLQQRQEQQATLEEHVRQLQRERDAATNRLAALADELAMVKKNPSEVLKLRGEVGLLRQENASAAATSALNKITANPETRKLLRDQQKLGMTTIYKAFVQRQNLSPELADKFNDLLADHVMDNVDQITEVLRDGKTEEQINQVFAGQDAALQEKLQALIGPDGVSQYREYTRNLGSTLTSEQFKAMLTGDDAAKQEKTKQLYQALQEATQAALASAGLPPDYQTVPMLNFRNIASEEQGEQSLKMLDSIYERVAARASTFLSPEELEKFKEFRAGALNTSRMSLTMNRKMMAPISK